MTGKDDANKNEQGSVCGLQQRRFQMKNKGGFILWHTKKKYKQCFHELISENKQEDPFFFTQHCFP